MPRTSHLAILIGGHSRNARCLCAPLLAVLAACGAVDPGTEGAESTEVVTAGRQANSGEAGRLAAGSGTLATSMGGTVASGSLSGSGSAGVSLGSAGSIAGSPSRTAGGAGSGLAAVSGTGAAGSAGSAGAGGANAAGSGGASSPVAGAAAPAADGDITIWLAGDSTVAKGNMPCPVGWGAGFQALFKPEAKVVNSAVGGRSVRTWLYEVQTTMDSTGECALNKDSAGEPVLQMRWQAMLDGMKSGDYLFIQFGINDSSRTCDRHVGLEAFKDSYGMMAEAAKMRGAQPIFVTPVSMIACEGSTAQPSRGAFVTATLEAGETYDVPVIDLHERSIALYNELGLCPIPGGSDVSASTGGKVGAFFCEDHTHFDTEGADQIAGLVAEALREQSLGLASYLK
jgi:lysophospholipase L1-like esterase